MAEKIKKLKNNKSKEDIIFTVSVVVIIILSLLLIISKNFGNFENVRLKKNNKTIFTVTDLTVNDLKFFDKEKTIKEKLGKPQKEKLFLDDIYQYKNLYYDGIILTLRENYEDFILVKVEITSSKYSINRKIKVNQNITKVFKKFKVENSTGTYLYGNYSINALNDSNIKDSIYLGLRNSKELLYVYRDSIIENENSNIAKLSIQYKHGRVSKIVWSYDFKI